MELFRVRLALEQGDLPEALERLEAGMRSYATVLERTFGTLVAHEGGMGAAGGLGAAARLFLSAEVVLSRYLFLKRMERAVAVIALAVLFLIVASVAVAV